MKRLWNFIITWILKIWYLFFKKQSVVLEQLIEPLKEIELKNHYLVEIRGELIPNYVCVDIDHLEEGIKKLGVNCSIPIPAGLRQEFNNFFNNSFTQEEWNKIQEYILNRPEVHPYV